MHSAILTPLLLVSAASVQYVAANNLYARHVDGGLHARDLNDDLYARDLYARAAGADPQWQALIRPAISAMRVGVEQAVKAGAKAGGKVIPKHPVQAAGKRLGKGAVNNAGNVPPPGQGQNQKRRRDLGLATREADPEAEAKELYKGLVGRALERQWGLEPREADADPEVEAEAETEAAMYEDDDLVRRDPEAWTWAEAEAEAMAKPDDLTLLQHDVARRAAAGPVKAKWNQERKDHAANVGIKIVSPSSPNN